jgi:hypothetical protein
MSKHIAISLEEAAHRLAIRELVDAYAHCADRRDVEGQMSLFTPDTHFVVYMNSKDPRPSQELHSRDALAGLCRTQSLRGNDPFRRTEYHFHVERGSRDRGNLLPRTPRLSGRRKAAPYGRVAPLSRYFRKGRRRVVFRRAPPLRLLARAARPFMTVASKNSL